MTRRYEHNGHQYWVTVEPAIHQGTNETGYIAYVSDNEPGGLFYGLSVRDHNGRTIFFTETNAAFINANAVKQGELDAAAR
jgi:hypothetical protein